jgi:hypothetical protein
MRNNLKSWLIFAVFIIVAGCSRSVPVIVPSEPVYCQRPIKQVCIKPDTVEDALEQWTYSEKYITALEATVNCYENSQKVTK